MARRTTVRRTASTAVAAACALVAGAALAVADGSPAARPPARRSAACGEGPCTARVGARSVVTSLPTLTPTVTPTTSSRATWTTTPISTPTHIASSTRAVTPTTSPTPATTARPPIYLPITVRAVTDPIADRVAARLMAMLDRPAERTRLVVWDWEAGVALVGLMTAYGDGRDPRVTRWVDDWLTRAVRAGWVDLDQPDLRLPNHVAPAWGALLRDAHAQDGRHEALFQATRSWLMRPPSEGGAPRVPVGAGADGWPGAWAHLPERPEVWDDTLFMAAPFLARYGQREGDEALTLEAARQLEAHAAVLQDPSTGLWFHGWSAASRDHLSGGRWARGNAWAALATTEVIDSLPAGHPLREPLRAALARQLAGLARLQGPSGLWTTEVTRLDFYTETSGSAGIVAAMYRSLAAGWLPSAYRAAADRGYVAVLGRIAADGTVTRVSAGTGVPTVEQGIALYNAIDASSIQPYGQGLALLMFEARERAEKAARAAGVGSP